MEQRIGIERMEEAINLFGSFDENIRLLESEFAVQVVNRGGEIVISGEPENVMLAEKAVQALLTLSGKGENISDQHVRYVIGLVRSGQAERISELTQDVICITSKGTPRQAQDARPEGVCPRDHGPHRHASASAPPARARPISPSRRPSPPSATSRSTASSSPAPRSRRASGWAFSPATCRSKVDPYLRPLYDALFDMLGAETYQKYLERGNIEVAPLAYMRGRTLDDSFIILDEAQNTAPRADEDVPHAHGLRLQGRHHGRCDADRPAGGQASAA